MLEQAVRTPDHAGRRPWTGSGALCAPLALLLSVLPVAPAAAADTDATAYGAPTTRCLITDPRLPELSGLAGVGEAMLAMNDGGDRAEVYVLDGSCAVVDVRSADVDPYDPEDLAVGADGTVWLADTGDNNQARATVALIGLRPDGSSTLTRLTYPDGAHDAEALLLAPDGTPYLVTKEVLGASAVYRPDAPLGDGVTVPMSEVLHLGFTLTGTPGGPVGRAGQLLVTGGAVSADGQRIALRTYTDAYVWPLSGSDVVGALSGEGLPVDVTVVPTTLPPVATVAAPPSAATGFGGLATGRSPVKSAVIAAVVAAVLVWLGDKLRRRRG